MDEECYQIHRDDHRGASRIRVTPKQEGRGGEGGAGGGVRNGRGWVGPSILKFKLVVYRVLDVIMSTDVTATQGVLSCIVRAYPIK